MASAATPSQASASGSKEAAGSAATSKALAEAKSIDEMPTVTFLQLFYKTLRKGLL